MPCRAALLKRDIKSVTSHVTYFLEVGQSTDESEIPGSTTGNKFVERQVHKKLYNQIFGIGYAKKFRIRKLHQDMTKVKGQRRSRKNMAAEVLLLS